MEIPDFSFSLGGLLEDKVVFSSHKYDFHSEFCSAGRGPITTCVWLDCLVFELLFFAIFLLAPYLARLFGVNFKKLHYFDQFGVSSRVPVVFFAVLEIAVLMMSPIWFTLTGMYSKEVDFEEYHFILQTMGPIAIGYWILEGVLVLYSNRTFTVPCEYHFNRKDAYDEETKRGRLNLFKKDHNALAEMQDAMPYFSNIMSLVMIIQHRSMGIMGIILIISSVSQVFVSLASLITLRWVSNSNIPVRVKPFSQVSSLEPIFIVKFMHATNDVLMMALKFVSGPYAMMHLWRCRNNIDNFLCVFLIFSFLRECGGYILILVNLVAGLFPGFLPDLKNFKNI